MTTEVESESLCRRRATSSRMALQTLSTRTILGLNVHSFSLLITGLGGRARTVVLAEQSAVRLRSSLTRTEAVYVPGARLVVSRRTEVVPLPWRVPPVEVQE